MDSPSLTPLSMSLVWAVSCDDLSLIQPNTTNAAYLGNSIIPTRFDPSLGHASATLVLIHPCLLLVALW